MNPIGKLAGGPVGRGHSIKFKLSWVICRVSAAIAVYLTLHNDNLKENASF